MHRLPLNTNFVPFPVLRTTRLSLRQITEKDVAEIFFLRSDNVVLRYLDKSPSPSPGETLEWIRRINDSERKGESITWGIAFGEDVLIGTICFWKLAKEHYRAEIGYALHPAMQGKGIMQEALTEVLNYGFKVMGLHSVEANVNPNNSSSIKLLERNGFVKEAHYKENYYFNGAFLDSAIYSLLKPADF